MDANRFDELTRAAASPATRRAFLRSLAGSLVAAAAGAVGVGGVAAARPRRCRGDADCANGQTCLFDAGRCCTAAQVCGGRDCCRIGDVCAVGGTVEGAFHRCCPAGSATGLAEHNACCPAERLCGHDAPFSSGHCCSAQQECAVDETTGRKGCCRAGLGGKPCGDRCCDSDEVCLLGDNRLVCCPAGSNPALCGGRCCPLGRACCNGRCCSEGQQCGSDGLCTRCADDQLRCGDTCCSQDRTCCANVCCEEGVSCGGDGTCQDAGTQVVVDAVSLRVATGISLTAGQQVTVTATGQIDLGSTAPEDCRFTGPDGCSTLSTCFVDNAYPETTAACGALMGQIDNGQPFLIGAAKTFAAAATGLLYLAVNDFPSEKGNNGGAFTASVSAG
jgi:hypothetical protein